MKHQIVQKVREYVEHRQKLHQIKIAVDSSFNALTKIDIFTFLADGTYLSNGKDSS
jgi:hypothetical protein